MTALVTPDLPTAAHLSLRLANRRHALQRHWRDFLALATTKDWAVTHSRPGQVLILDAQLARLDLVMTSAEAEMASLRGLFWLAELLAQPSRP